MNDKDLDNKLHIARYQSEKFFEQFNFDQSRKIVLKKIFDEENNKSKTTERFLTKFNTKVFIKCMATALSLIFIAIFVKQVGNRNLDSLGSPVLQQTIELDNIDNNHLINYFRLDNPNNNNNILAVLWQKDLKGDYEIIYSSIMENTNIPNPVTVMNIPFSDSKFALVSSSNNDKNFIHYRLIKYNNNSTETYLEKNYVPEGKVSFYNGMLIEERTISNDYHIKENNSPVLKSRKIYRYFIPIELNNNGRFSIAANEIKLKKGAILTFLLDRNTVPLEFEYNDRIINETNKNFDNNDVNNTSINFEVIEKGFVNLIIRQKEYTNQVNEILIEVVD